MSLEHRMRDRLSGASKPTDNIVMYIHTLIKKMEDAD